MLTDIVTGVLSIFDPAILVLMLGGTIIGLIFGIIPGLSGLTALAILSPLCYGMDAKVALAFLMATYAVAYTGGSVTAVLLNIPGTGPNAATLLDGFPMTQQGKGGRALGNAMTASGLGGVVGAVVLAFLIPVVRPIVLSFASPECFFLVLLGISFVVILSRGSTLKGFAAGGLGLILSFGGYQGATL